MAVAAEQGGYLFQLAPHLFPEGYVTGVELGLWFKFYEDRNKALAAYRKR